MVSLETLAPNTSAKIYPVVSPFAVSDNTIFLNTSQPTLPLLHDLRIECRATGPRHIDLLGARPRSARSWFGDVLRGPVHQPVMAD